MSPNCRQRYSHHGTSGNNIPRSQADPLNWSHSRSVYSSRPSADIREASPEPAALQRMSTQPPPGPPHFLPSPRTSFDSTVINNMVKWGLKFDGTARVINLQEFLFRANLLNRDQMCPDYEFVTNFHSLLESPALDWYWDLRKRNDLQTWTELRQEMIDQYQSHKHDTQILRQLVSRRHKKNSMISSRRPSH